MSSASPRARRTGHRLRRGRSWCRRSPPPPRAAHARGSPRPQAAARSLRDRNRRVLAGQHDHLGLIKVEAIIFASTETTRSGNSSRTAAMTATASFRRDLALDSPVAELDDDTDRGDRLRWCTEAEVGTGRNGRVSRSEEARERCGLGAQLRVEQRHLEARLRHRVAAHRCHGGERPLRREVAPSLRAHAGSGARPAPLRRRLRIPRCRLYFFERRALTDTDSVLTLDPGTWSSTGRCACSHRQQWIFEVELQPLEGDRTKSHGRPSLRQDLKRSMDIATGLHAGVGGSLLTGLALPMRVLTPCRRHRMVAPSDRVTPYTSGIG